MLKPLIAVILIILMSSIASAELVEDWPYEQRNVMPDYIEGVMYDFEEGSNCVDFKNQYPEIATFLTVLDGNVPDGYGPSYPSYAAVGGSMCGNMRCYMRIFPHPSYENHTGIVNGRAGFCPISCCEANASVCWTGNCCPNMDARIQFKEGTNYVSFLASTYGNMYVTLYTMKGSNYEAIHYEKIETNTHRVNGEPSNFTQFIIHVPGVDIARMDVEAGFNFGIIDDLIIGGAPGYLSDIEPEPEPDPTPPEEALYSWAAERLELLIGAPYNPNGFGIELQSGTFYPAEDIISNPLVVNWDAENKEWITGEGINNEGAIIWALNENSNLINNLCINDMASKDFKVLVEYGDQQPGDVAFIEYDTTATDEASIGYDEIIMFIEPQIDPGTGATEDCIRILEDVGVHYADSEFVHALYGADTNIVPTSLFTVKRLLDAPKGKKSPYPNIPGKFKI